MRETKTLKPGDRRRVADAKNAWRKATDEQRMEILAWIVCEGGVPPLWRLDGMDDGDILSGQGGMFVDRAELELADLQDRVDPDSDSDRADREMGEAGFLYQCAAPRCGNEISPAAWNRKGFCSQVCKVSVVGHGPIYPDRDGLIRPMGVRGACPQTAAILPHKGDK